MATAVEKRGAALRSVSATFSETIDAWAVDQAKSVDGLQQDLAATLAANHKKLGALEKQQELLEAKVKELKASLQREVAELDGQVRQSQALQEKTAEFPLVIAQLTERRTQAETDLQQQKHLLDEKRREKKAVVDELTIGVEMYRERLGLSFERLSGGRLRCAFTCVDPQDDRREFAFVIRVQDGRYEMDSCSPRLPAELVDEEVRSLNQSQEFSRFVRSMRRLFKGTC